MPWGPIRSKFTFKYSASILLVSPAYILYFCGLKGIGFAYCSPLYSFHSQTYMQHTGKISQIIGPVIDVSFETGAKLPKIYHALYVERPDGQKVVLECQQHLGEDSVRTIAMDSTEGLVRGMAVIDTG